MKNDSRHNYSVIWTWRRTPKHWLTHPICFLLFHHIDPLNFSSELFSWQQVPFSSVLCPSDKNQNNTQKTLALEAIKPPLGILFSVFLNLFSKNSLREFVSDWMSLAYWDCNGLWALCSTTIEGLWTLKLIRRKEGEKPSNLILLSLQVILLCRIYRTMGWYNNVDRNSRLSLVVCAIFGRTSPGIL